MRRRGVGRRTTGLIGTAARTAVIAGTATSVAGRVAQSQARTARGRVDAGAERGAAPTAPQVEAPPASPVAGLPEGLIDQLRQLGELRDSGILTQEEFAAQKTRLLGT